MVSDQAWDGAYLGESSLFLGLNPGEAQRLAELAETGTYGDGETVVVEGSLGDSLYVLHDGAVDILARDRGGSEVLLTTVTDQGAFFGEVALVDPGPRSATIRARGNARLLRFTVDRLETFFAEFPETQVLVLRNIARVLARRLRESNVRYVAVSAD